MIRANLGGMSQTSSSDKALPAAAEIDSIDATKESYLQFFDRSAQGSGAVKAISWGSLERVAATTPPEPCAYLAKRWEKKLILLALFLDYTVNYMQAESRDAMFISAKIFILEAAVPS